MTSRPAAGHAGQPAIVVDAVEHDFGSVWAGEKLEHTFRITNTGTGELTITSVRPHCGCMVAGSYPKSLAPPERRPRSPFGRPRPRILATP